tara:strand:+ start:557 stop:688 length:132 start_codon:yes stop_codon:yes gene_type:complete
MQQPRPAPLGSAKRSETGVTSDGERFLFLLAEIVMATAMDGEK